MSVFRSTFARWEPPGRIWIRSLARFGTLAARIRGRHLLAIDVLSTAVAAWLALSIRFDQVMSPNDLAAFAPGVFVPLAVRPLVNERFGLYRQMWRHATVHDLTLILRSQIAGSVVSTLLFLLLVQPVFGSSGDPVPPSFWLAELMVSLAFVGGSRFLIRVIDDLDLVVRSGDTTVQRTPALLFGAGRAGAQMAQAALREPRAGVKPVGFLDEDRGRHGATVAGFTVYGGLDRLEETARRTGARMVLITMPDAPGSAVRRVSEKALSAGLEVRRVPPMHEMLDGSIDATRVRRVKVEDLLSRAPMIQHAPGVGAVIRDGVVMVTGAGGSIGSELARQVYAMGPRALVLVDRAESSLYLIQRELELRRDDGRGSGVLSVHLANVASRAVMSRLIASTRPSVIFHAAACKHVPMMEEHPSEAVQVNVGGTMSVLGAAEDAGVPRFVLVSTDKAVEPSSVMGATKRLAEWLVADAARRTGLAYVSVRFGNVLGSAGSVLPVLQSQLENGEPMTLTHPDMTRYFMTIQEAGCLILDAAAIGRAGDLFLLEMGEPVRIVDMIRDLVRLSGRDPETVEIKVTGIRPGEKMHEQLFYDSETVVPTEVEKIVRVIGDREPGPLDVQERARALIDLAFGDRDEELRRALFTVVSREPGYPPGRTEAGICPQTDPLFVPRRLEPGETNLSRRPRTDRARLRAAPESSSQHGLGSEGRERLGRETSGHRVSASLE